MIFVKNIFNFLFLKIDAILNYGWIYHGCRRKNTIFPHDFNLLRMYELLNEKR